MGEKEFNTNEVEEEMSFVRPVKPQTPPAANGRGE